MILGICGLLGMGHSCHIYCETEFSVLAAPYTTSNGYWRNFFLTHIHSGLVRENSCDKATCNYFINVKAQNATDNDTYSTYTVACIILTVKIFTLLSTNKIIL